MHTSNTEIFVSIHQYWHSVVDIIYDIKELIMLNMLNNIILLMLTC